MRDADRDVDLLAAYVDGVAELTPDERRRIEAVADAGELAATRTLLDQLRALPSAGNEPDWSAMERSIRAQLPDRVPRAWWRVHLRWLVPTLACAAAGAIALFVLAHPGDGDSGEPAAVAHVAPSAPATPSGTVGETPHPVAVVAAADPHAGHHFVWLDGQAIDVDDVPETQLLDSLKPAPGHDDDADPSDSNDGNEGLLGSPGLAWVDDLDSAKLDRLENVLAEPVAPPSPSKKGT